MASVTQCDNVFVEKSLQSTTEDIIVVTGDHMAGPGDVDQLGGREQLEKLLAPSSLTTFDSLPRTSIVGTVTAAAAFRARS
ncbi:hypothetical protein ACNJ7E_39775 [Rhodococcus sp. NM-2]|uniref:hypothetical protein n=1 Tax=Rhodococcus sp. NM-2 TaxID=3401174 RepID=UPI003AAEF98A